MKTLKERATEFRWHTVGKNFKHAFWNDGLAAAFASSILAESVGAVEKHHMAKREQLGIERDQAIQERDNFKQAYQTQVEITSLAMERAEVAEKQLSKIQQSLGVAPGPGGQPPLQR